MEWHAKRKGAQKTRRVTIRVPAGAQAFLPPPYTDRKNLVHETGARTIAEGNRLGAPWIEKFKDMRDTAIAAAGLRGGYRVVPFRSSEIITHQIERGGFGSRKIWSGALPADLHQIEPGVYIRVGHPDHPQTVQAPIKLADARRVAQYEDVIAEFAKRKGKDPEKDQGIARKRFVMRELAAYLEKLRGHGDDMNRATTREIDSYFADLALRGISQPSIRDRYIHLNALFGWAATAKRHIDQNPMAEIEPQGAKSKNRGVMFYDEQRAVILRAADAIDWRADPDLAPIKFANLIAGYMGRELGAIVEARTFDFSQLSDGMWVFDIRRDTDRPLKTDEREGKLALHPAIVRAGFPDYLAWVRETYDEGDLFPMLTVTKDGRRNTTASNAIMAWLRSLQDVDGKPVITDPRQRFHSWRHTITTLLTGKVDPDRVRFIIGHAGVDTHAKIYKKHPPAEVAEALATLPDPLL